MSLVDVVGDLVSLVASAKHARGQRDDLDQGGDNAERRRERRHRGDAADYRRLDKAARVGDDGDAGNAARGMGAYAPGRGEHKRDDDSKADPEQREAEKTDRKAGRQHDHDRADNSLLSPRLRL